MNLRVFTYLNLGIDCHIRMNSNAVANYRNSADYSVRADGDTLAQLSGWIDHGRRINGRFKRWFRSKENQRPRESEIRILCAEDSDAIAIDFLSFARVDR